MRRCSTVSDDISPPADNFLLIEQLFDRAVTGEAGPEEQRAYAVECAQTPGVTRQLDAVHAVTRSPEAYGPVTTYTSGEARTFAQRARTRTITPARRPMFAGRRLLTPGRIAAAIALIVMLVIGRTMAVRSETSVGATYRTGPAQLSRITLPDSTRVTLAPNSTLRVAADFSRERTITLDGHAYVDVKTSTGIPFLVRTGTTTTRILGTAFDIRHYAIDPAVQVMVVAGKVVTVSRRGATVLSAGMTGIFTDSVTRTTAIDDERSVMAWTNGQLVFRATPVADMLRSIGAWYGVDFRFADSTARMSHVTVTLTLDHMTREQTITALESLLDVRMSVDATHAKTPTITIHPGPVRERSKPAPARHNDTFTPTPEIGR